MEVTILGGAREVGKQSLYVKGNSSSILLDYGAHTGREPSFPMHVKPKEVHSLLLTHAHLDHSGGVPLYFLREGVKLLTTGPTLELSSLLLDDFIKLSGFYLPFERVDLITMAKSVQRVALNETKQVTQEFAARFPNSGHLPGGVTILLEQDGRRILYTGDVNLTDSQLLKGADTDFGDLDAVFTESTYSMVDHEPRAKIETDFVNFANEVVEQRGVLLVPAFSVGRAQEIACLLRSKNFKHLVAMDGMALKTNEILFRHQDFLRDPELFRKTIENIEVVSDWGHRKRLVKTPSVIIAPAGMLMGGASVYYNQQLSQNEKNGITIVAFQAPGTPGRTLLDRGLTLMNGKPVPVKAQVKRFDFSGHSGRTELFEMISRFKGRPKVYALHGDGDTCVTFAKQITERFGLEASAPQNGDKMEI